MNERDLPQAFQRALVHIAETAIAGLENERKKEPVSIALPHPFSNMTREDWHGAIESWLKHGAPLLDSLAGRPCPACGEEAHDFLFRSFDGHPYVECCACRCWYVPLKVNGDLYRRYFEHAPSAKRYGDYTNVQDVDPDAAAHDRTRFREYYQDLRTAIGAGEVAASLDIGCGVGNSLDAATEFGFDPAGVEVNENAVGVARRVGRSVFYPDEPLPHDTFEVITLWETLEHLDKPLETLRWAKTRLADGGLLAITVPNLNSPCIRSMRGDSLQIHGGPAWPGHINLYTAATLTKVLERAGLRVVDVASQYSMNLFELIAYHLGQWSGARDYARVDSPHVTLPATAAALARSLGPLVTAWEGAFAFGPILRIFATHAGAPEPSGLEGLQAARAARITQTLSQAYGGGGGEAALRARGTAIVIAEGSWRDESLQIAGDSARLTAAPDSPYAYIWKSAPMTLSAGDVIRLRGYVYEGGVALGLLSNGAWTTTCARSDAGAFALTAAVERHGVYEVVITHHNESAAPTDIDIGILEHIKGG